MSKKLKFDIYKIIIPAAILSLFCSGYLIGNSFNEYSSNSDQLKLLDTLQTCVRAHADCSAEKILCIGEKSILLLKLQDRELDDDLTAG